MNMKIRQLLTHDFNNKEILLAHVLNKPKVFIISHPEYNLGILELSRYFYFLLQFKRGYSIAAITHHKEFFKLVFFVNKHVLIPRPETELIVEDVLNELQDIKQKSLLIDIGTGSGCIPIAIDKNNHSPLNIIALDISRKALKVARINIEKYQSNIKLVQSNLLSKILPTDLDGYERIFITANLPYLTQKQLDEEPSIKKEPQIALVAAEQGLALYRKTLEQIQTKFANKRLLIYFEIDPDQKEAIQKLTLQYLPQAKLEIKKDLAGLSRTLKIST